nr:hypothetical protein [uncultured Oscillibacter sp.]
MSVTYYSINEELARRAKEMNSFYDYVPGSATQAYQRSVDRAAQIAEFQKQRVDPIHHDKIDHLLDTYARKLAENTNRSNEIAARVPSILIAGGGNFPVRKKEKQDRADETNRKEWREIQGLLDKIRSTGLGGISADDPEAVSKLEAKLEKLQRFQETMKAVNAYYKKNKTLDGCPHLSAEGIEKLKAEMAHNWRAEPKPYESYDLANNNASIRQVKSRIEELKKQAETVYIGWDFEGGFVDVDRAANRLQVFFDDKPEREVCAAMRHAGFRWAPSVGAWQRQLNSNAFYAADHLECIKPLSGELPTELQKRARKAVQEEAQETADGWGFYIIADLKTWADNAENRSPLEHFPSFEAAKARFEELRDEPYNSEPTEPGPDGQPPARLTLGLEHSDGMSSTDILHVRQGKNYLVTDFVRTERVRDDPAVMDILSRATSEIGFDFVRVYEQAGDERQHLTVIPFAEWDNPYFPSATPGRIAAQYYELTHRCYPIHRDPGLRAGQIASIVQFIQEGGKNGANQMSMAVAGLGISFRDNDAVQEQVTALINELAQYTESERGDVSQQKACHKKSRER